MVPPNKEKFRPTLIQPQIWSIWPAFTNDSDIWQKSVMYRVSQKKWLYCWSHGAQIQSPVAGTPCVWKNVFGRFFTKRDQALPSHVHRKIWHHSIMVRIFLFVTFLGTPCKLAAFPQPSFWRFLSLKACSFSCLIIRKIEGYLRVEEPG